MFSTQDITEIIAKYVADNVAKCMCIVTGQQIDVLWTGDAVYSNVFTIKLYDDFATIYYLYGQSATYPYHDPAFPTNMLELISGIVSNKSNG